MPEHQNIEYKESWRDEYLKWICGFANAQGGKIYIGIDDKGAVKGITDCKKLLEDIPNKSITHLGLVVDVNLHKKEGKHYLEIVVPTSDVPISYHGSYHYRSGSTKQELKGQHLHRFILKKMGKSWDDIPMQNTTLEDIDEASVQFFLKRALDKGRISPDAASDDLKSLLENLELFNEEGRLKSAAILLFGKKPKKYFTTAYFKIGRFGTSDHDLRFQDVIEGNILTMADKVIEVLRSKYLVASISYKGLERLEQLEYPEPALREAILNAIVHKDYTDTFIQLSVYDDKLILWNPGSLPDELSIEQLKSKHPSKPRNKNIAEIFFKAGYIEAWGRGITKMIEACAAAGLPEPIIEELAGGIQVTFQKDIYTETYLQQLGLERRLIEALLFIKQNDSITNTQYQELLKVSKRTATNDLQLLMEKGLVTKIGTTGKGTSYMLQRGSKGAKRLAKGQ
ncbi:putative DNA binding domain-containing protein [Chitinophagaceae bacterium LB-8]|uniref:DNA binding domain-containing protein n=1 Tax=Paraflavisolibacter caeni TaxID=2982496 RepID=A0A9X2XV45_9BACT|nr:ATP-binding protein [Paraflavisolibacter caeni]MCU7549874.1 putative DNA binding domain-containing protein [Paraflavisolibacter caeni]